MISFWRGTWDYAIIYIDEWRFNATEQGFYKYSEENCIYSNLFCIAIGIIGNIVIQYNHEFIKTKIAANQSTQNDAPIRRTAWFMFISRIYRLE